MTKFNSDMLPQGIPLLRDYLSLLKTGLFLEIESFSNSFVKYHCCKHDPFHQWSRRWEYPFAYSHIRRYIASNDRFMQSKDTVKILDAGSGFTFFPYYISHKHANCNVYCCDYDYSLINLFDSANKKSKQYIDFKVYDLTNLGYNDNSFDITYCISVLEHASNHAKIFEQFKRVLKPNGLLIVSFDISLEDKDKNAKETQNVLDQLNDKFEATDANLKTLNIASESEILTTRFAKDFDKNSLPWASTWSSILGNLVKLKVPRRPFSLLTMFCGVWRNTKHSYPRKLIQLL